MNNNNYTALSSTIASLTRKVKLITLLSCFSVLMAGCNNIEATREKCDESSGCATITGWTTEGELVTLRVKVLSDRNIPILDLNQGDFQIETRDGLGISQPPIQPEVTLPTSDQAEVTPADVVILLDMSGSMRHNDSSSTNPQIKLNGAINAIQAFLDTANQENLPINVSIAPLGYGCYKTESNFEVTPQSLKENLLPVNSSNFKQQLEKYAKTEVCASTNLYAPLETAVTFLREENPLANQETTNNDFDKQLVVILLSDGFHNYQRETEAEQFTKLKNVLEAQNQTPVTVHTLGYGESLLNLYKNSNCDKLKLTEEQLTNDETIKTKKLMEQVANKCTRKDNVKTKEINESDINIQEFIVDQPRLKEIAILTEGVHQFPDNADAVAKSLIEFLASLRQYELKYIQPGAERANRYFTKVRIVPKDLASNEIPIRICNIGCPPLKLEQRFAFFLGTLIIFGLAGVLPFVQWSKKLK